MAGMGLPDIVRGKAMKTTFPDASVPCSRDKVNRQFRAAAPNLLWVNDFISLLFSRLLEASTLRPSTQVLSGLKQSYWRPQNFQILFVRLAKIPYLGWYGDSVGASMMSKRRHVFISHHHADDEQVNKLTKLLGKKSYDIRNSSIRAKPSNQARIDAKQIPERTLKRMLRMKMSWAGTVIVLIGKKTHQRPWVDWEIKKANELGKRIVGVYTHGGTEVDIPAAFEKYGDALVNWNSDSVIDAIEGKDSHFENPGSGTTRDPVHAAPTSKC
jgi:hypothetical protein